MSKTWDSREYPVSQYKFLEGRKLITIEADSDSDEGFILTFEDGSTLTFGFSGCEGIIKRKCGKCGGACICGYGP